MRGGGGESARLSRGRRGFDARLPRGRRGFDARLPRADVAGSTPAKDVPDDRDAYLIPDALPLDAPAIDPSRAVPRAAADILTVAEFHARFVAPGRAVVLEGCLTPSRGWAPASEWRDLRALVRGDGAGERVVPVEYGGFGDRRGTGVSTLGDFVRDFLLPSNRAARGSVPNGDASEYRDERNAAEPRTAYVSQHALFHQIPSLQRLFSVPAYTLGRLRADAGAVNAWLGTKDTATALHRDPYLNLLAQTAGFKYVRLYADDQTEMLYPDAAVRGGTITRSRGAPWTSRRRTSSRFRDSRRRHSKRRCCARATCSSCRGARGTTSGDSPRASASTSGGIEIAHE